MDRERCDAWLERGILVLVLAALVWAPLATGAVREQDFAISLGLLAVAVVLWVARFWLNPSHRVQWVPACWAVAAFLGLAVVRYLQADVEYPARQEWIRILTYAWLFALVLNNLHRQSAAQWLLGVLLALGTLISAYAAYQIITGSTKVWWFPQPLAYRGRGSGTYICPDHLAGLLEMLIPVALAGAMVSRARPVGRVFFGYAALAMVAGLGATLSRGGYLSAGCTVGAMILFLLTYRSYRKHALLALVVLGIVCTVAIFKAERVHKRFVVALQSGQKDSGMDRLDLWRPAVAMWKDHPWFGVGPAHYDVRFPQYRSFGFQTRPVWAHNDYANALAEWGGVGSFLVGAFFVCVGFGAVRTWRYVQGSESTLGREGSDRAAVVLGTGVGLGALMVHSFVDFNWHIPANAMVAVALLGVLSSHVRFSTARFWVTPNWFGRLLATLCALGSLVFLVPQGWRMYREGVALTRFEAAPTDLRRFQALQAAWEVEQRNPETPQYIGELYRLGSWEGLDHWRDLAEEAIKWFDIGIRLNPFETFNYYRKGMCLDWLGRPDDARPWFEKAVSLDPENHYVSIMRGWHEMQVGNWAEARVWMQRSLKQLWYSNWLAQTYLRVIEQHLPKPAANPTP